MTNKELQELLQQFPDELPIHVSHPDGDWSMSIYDAKKYPEDNHLSIITEFIPD